MTERAQSDGPTRSNDSAPHAERSSNSAPRAERSSDSASHAERSSKSAPHAERLSNSAPRAKRSSDSGPRAKRSSDSAPRAKRSALSRVTLAFVLLGAAVLLPVGGLVWSAVSRLERQARLRHQMVAERVFDETERELSALLQHEAERPREAYDMPDTDPARWSRFVIGYYRRAPGLELIAEDRLSSERRARIRSSVERALPQLEGPDDAPHARALRPAETEAAPDAQRSSPDVLRQLNRSVKVRARRQHRLSEVFTVVPIGSDRLVLERRAEGGRREGFVLDVPVLVSTMQSWVLSSQGLDAVAALRLGPRAEASAGAYGFTHRLAAPLDSQVVSLSLSRLDDDDESSVLYGLLALVSTAVVLGLFAVYRMVAVQIRFSERRNNFVSAVTHELRTPLTSIRMYGEMLRDGMVEDEATRREYYATITAEGERLTRLINNVMDHAKLQRGQRAANVQRADIGSTVREVVELMTPHIEHEGFAIELSVDEALPAALIDLDAIKQVLFNVLDNAIKYGRGKTDARIVVRCSAGEGGVLVSVRDFGPGVAAAEVEAAFEPFFRGGNELTRTQKGTGLGLSLVRDLVSLMNGRVHGENKDPGFEVKISLCAG